MKDDQIYLIHITECIERLDQYTIDGKDFFLNDTKTQDAVIRNLQTLAESTQNLSDSLKDNHTEIDWKSIAGFRNVVVHDYLGIEMEEIWDIVERDIPDLKQKILSIRKELLR